MKLDQLFEKQEKKKGTYMAVKFTKDTNARLKRFIEKNKIPNGMKEDFHTTIIYSRNYVPELKGRGKLKEKIIGTPTKLEVFETQQGWKALVLRYDCPELTERHEEIMKNTNATYDYPEYKVHVSLSYNIEDYSIDKLKELSLEPIGEIIINDEYVEELNLDWASSKVKSEKESND